MSDLDLSVLAYGYSFLLYLGAPLHSYLQPFGSYVVSPSVTGMLAGLASPAHPSFRSVEADFIPLPAHGQAHLSAFDRIVAGYGHVYFRGPETKPTTS